ncbi:hypothetical protein ABBQ32_001378 [Trebouxia sp. C0010 RCD-2024]
MNIQFHDAAEIQAVAMEDSLQEPVVQTALATELASEAVLAPTEHQHATWNRWTTVLKALNHAWDVADEHLANWFGLNESKYEWAVREYYWQKRQEEEEQTGTPQSSRSQAPADSSYRSQEFVKAAAESQALQGSAMV